jgi:hypothetical protein
MDVVALMERCTREHKLARRGEYSLPLAIDLGGALSIVACLQLALRHPQIPEAQERIARGIVAGMIERVRRDGFPASAELMELGNNPENDYAP